MTFLTIFSSLSGHFLQLFFNFLHKLLIKLVEPTIREHQFSSVEPNAKTVYLVIQSYEHRIEQICSDVENPSKYC